MNDTIIYMPPSRRAGMAYKQYTEFIEHVKKGEQSLLWGPGYVVVSEKYFNSLIVKAEGKNAETFGSGAHIC